MATATGVLAHTDTATVTRKRRARTTSRITARPTTSKQTWSKTRSITVRLKKAPCAHVVLVAISLTGELFEYASNYNPNSSEELWIFLGKRSRGNASVRAAFVHVVGDLLQSISVLISALIIFFKVSGLQAETPFLNKHDTVRKLIWFAPSLCYLARIQDGRPHLHLPVLFICAGYHLHHHEGHSCRPDGG